MREVIWDASFFLSYLLPDEKYEHKIFELFKKEKIKLIEPFIFELEVTNTLRYAFKAKRLSKKKLLKTVELFQNLKNIEYVFDFDLSKLTKTALKKDLSIYDSCYLYLANYTSLPLYSLDKKLKQAYK